MKNIEIRVMDNIFCCRYHNNKLNVYMNLDNKINTFICSERVAKKLLKYFKKSTL